MQKLNRTDLTERYDQIIQEQIHENIVESASGDTDGREFYIPHKSVSAMVIISFKVHHYNEKGYMTFPIY